MSNTDLAALAAELKEKGVRALTVTWCDANGIQRSRSAPIDKLAAAVDRGMGCSFLFAVFDSHDHIRWGVEGLDNPSGDFRVKAVPERIVQLAGQPAFAWAPGQLWRQEGARWEHCYRAALERAVERAAGLGYEFKAGLELEWFIGEASDEPVAAHHGPVYSPNAMLDVSEFVSELLARPRRQRPRHRPDPRRVRLVAARDLARRGRPADRGRQPAARARDDSRSVPRQRPALLVRAADHARRRRQRLALPPVAVQGRPQPAVGRQRSRGHDARGRGLRRRDPARPPGRRRRDVPERAVADPPASGLLRERLLVLGRRQPRGLAALRARRRGDRGAEREHRAQGLGRVRQPLPRPDRDDRLRARRHRGRARRCPSRSARIRAAGRPSSARRPASGASPRTSRSRSRTSRRPRASARRSAIRSRMRSSACAATTRPGPTGKSADEVVGTHLWKY